MEKQRFPPASDTALAVQLQKEIYRKEERALHQAFSPVKASFQKDDIERFGGMTEIRRPKDLPSYNTFSPNPENYSKRRMNSDLDYRSNDSRQNKSLENVYRSKIAAATLKERYDFNNRSPINWLAKQEKLVSPQRSVGSTQDHGQISMLLNSKKVFKGMGYAKSNIFTN